MTSEKSEQFPDRLEGDVFPTDLRNKSVTQRDAAGYVTVFQGPDGE
jgi:hypothetical protein